MPNSTPRPWRMFLPLAIVLLLAGLWSVYWFIASGIAEDRLASERQRLAAQGVTLACIEERWGGYPFRFEFSCTSPWITYAGKAEARSTKLLMVALAYAPWQVAALLDGPTNLSAPGLMPTEITHEKALAAVTLDTSWQPSLSVEVPTVSSDALGKAEKLMLFTRPSASGGIDLALEGSGISYLPEGKPPVMLDSARMRGTLTPDRVFRLDSFELSQGELRYWGSGSLALDADRRISGQIDTETNDLQALLAVAGPQLGISDGKLANLRTMLGLLGEGAKASIIAKDGTLYVGPFQVAELTPLY